MNRGMIAASSGGSLCRRVRSGSGRWKLSMAAGFIVFSLLGVAALGDVPGASSLSENDCIVSFGTSDIAQDFLAESLVITGARVKLRAGEGDGQPGDVTISMWTGLPNAGGVVVATGTALGVSAGEFAEVHWSPVGAVANVQAYLLVFTGTNSTLCLAGNTANPYPSGQAYAGAGYQPLASTDFVFELLALESEYDVSVPFTDACLVTTVDEIVQSFQPGRPGCAGASFFIAPVGGGVGDLLVELWDDLPGGGANLLASGEAKQRADGQWFTAAWPTVELDVGGTAYFLEISTANNFCMSGSQFNYPSGAAYSNGVQIGDWDLAFEVISTDYPCVYGSVNQSRQNVLHVNGSPGTFVDHVVAVEPNDTIWGAIFQPATGGNGKYVLHANLDSPTSGTSVVLPASIGTVCFPFILTQGGDPDAVWNNIGKPSLVGTSKYLDGSPIADPARAPAVFLSLPDGDFETLPSGTDMTIQGVIVDPASPSPKGVSATNAVIVQVQ